MKSPQTENSLRKNCTTSKRLSERMTTLLVFWRSVRRHATKEETKIRMKKIGRNLLLQPSYVRGLSEEVRRILGKYNIRTAFRTTSTLGGILTKVKGPTPPHDRAGVI